MIEKSKLTLSGWEVDVWQGFITKGVADGIYESRSHGASFADEFILGTRRIAEQRWPAK